jgi:hypothetical protein
VSKTLEQLRSADPQISQNIVDDCPPEPEPEPARVVHPPFPVKVKWGELVKYNPEGNTAGPQIAYAYSDLSMNGHLDLVIIPANGGVMLKKFAVMHHSKFDQITNVNTRRNGSWSAMNE